MKNDQPVIEEHRVETQRTIVGQVGNDPGNPNRPIGRFNPDRPLSHLPPEDYNEQVMAGSENGSDRMRVVARISQVIDYGFWLIYTMLALRFVLAMVAARSQAGVVVFVRSVTDFLFAPFRGIVASPTVEGGFTFAFPILIAILVYGLMHLAINGFFRLIVYRKTRV